MLSKGMKLKTDAGHRIRIGDEISRGGQACVYRGEDQSTGQAGVIKDFLPQYATPDTARRNRFLVAQRLQDECSVLVGPIDSVGTGRVVGHFSPFAEGQALEDFLTCPQATFMESLKLAAALARALGVMHRRQIAHGDIHATNIKVRTVAGASLEPYLFDFDNFNAPGQPLPPMVGQNLYLAPELRLAIAQGRPAVPDLCTDRYSFGVIMHEIVLLKHTAAGFDGTENEFQKAMASGRWLHDLASAERPGADPGGLPTGVLDADLARLFRCSVSLTPDERPTPAQWEQALCRALNSVYLCPFCTCPFVIDAAKTKCPLCGRNFPALQLHLAGGKTVVLDAGAVQIGRALMPSFLKVSSLHAVFRRVGPQTWVQSFGRNGTYRWTGSGWLRVPEDRAVLVQKGDRLRFADAEAQVA